MKVIVNGCGKIGIAIAKCLFEEKHEVTVIDSEQSVLDELINVIDVKTVCGTAANREVLLEAGVDGTELFVAVTGSDELNMLSCFIATSLGAKHTIARVRNTEYDQKNLSFLCREMKIGMAVNPEKLTARALYSILKFPSAAKVETFSRMTFQMVEYRLHDDSVLSGMSLMQMRARFNAANYLVCVVQRDDEVFIPDGQFILRAGDRIGITATPLEIQKLFRSLRILEKQARNVLLLGGSRTAEYLTEMLQEAGSSVRIIERSSELCEHLCDRLPDADVVCGDGAHQDLLLEEGLTTMDAYVTLTGLDELNILSALFAQQEGIKAIAKVSREELYPMAEKMVERVISPQKIVTDIVRRYARALHNSIDSSMETLYDLMDGKAEAIEFTVLPDFPAKRIPLRELKRRGNVLIAGIVRAGTPIIPTGDTFIEEGDRVVVIASGRRIQALTDILA